MAAAPDAQKKEAEVTINERLTDFIQKNRSILFIGLIAIVVALAGFIIIVTVRDKTLEKALSRIDEFSRRYESVRIDPDGDDPDALNKMDGVLALLEELTVFNAKNSGFAAARSYSLTADIYWDLKNWAEAENAWLSAAKAAAKSYLAPVSFYNAAVAAEEREDIDSAIAHYSKALDYGSIFPSAVRAQFSIGRLEESRNRKDAALEAYRNILNNWPNDPVWLNLAQSRILVLSN